MKKIRLKLKFNQEIKLKNILEYFENVAFFKKDKIWILDIFLFSEIEEIIDSRTSDAISLALRFRAPIFAHEIILEKAAVVIDDNSLDNQNETKE